MRRLAAAWLLIAASATAATTATWELAGMPDFLRGRMSGLSLTRDGRLTRGPRLETVYSSDQVQIWSLAQAPDGSVYLGTGNRGRLIRVAPNGQASPVWTADQPVIFALAVDRAGVVYAGTSPDGKVYRIANGQATEYFSPQESYIWALAIASDGALMVATGPRGRIYRVTAANQGSVYYETGQTHVTALAFDREGRLLAGSEPNGILYRITGTPAKGFVLYDANLPEIRTILPQADGSVYAAALGGSVARRTTAATTSSTGAVTVTAPATSITVTDAQAGNAQAAVGPAPRAAVTSTLQTSSISAPATTTEVTGVERSALFRIRADNTVEQLWSSKEENLYDILAENDGNLLLLTDVQGRLYRIDAAPDHPRTVTLVLEANEGDATRLAPSPVGTLLATGSAAKLLRVTNANAPASWFESPVHDASTIARWGRLSWTGDARGVRWLTRSGNSARPDPTWSEWAEAVNSNIASPNARYIQWRAEFNASATAALDRVSLAYLPQNSAPTVRSITLTAQAANLLKAPAPASATAAFTITVTDTGDASTAASTQSQWFPRPQGQQLQISWQADDPEADRLLYSLYFRADDERAWKLLRADSSENTFTLESDSLADGRYLFRVVASDRLSNPADQARQGELISTPVVIDGTPPMLKSSAPRRTGDSLEIDVDGEDAGSSLRRCEYSIDAKPWQPVEASDGVTDSNRERFLVRITGLAQGEHTLVIRALDAAGNAGLLRVVVP